jgi:threonine/homoserine/homoserine lactone efflux protein
VDPWALVGYWGFVVAVVAVPGPDWAYTLASACATARSCPRWPAWRSGTSA